MTPQFPKTCGCGLIYTEADWNEILTLKGVYKDEECTLEMRNCLCGSTLAVELEGLVLE